MAFKIDKIAAQKPKGSRKDLDSFLKKEITIFGSSFSNKKKEAFYTELSVLLKAGISLKEALSLQNESYRKKKDQELFTNIIDEIVNGRSLSEAIKSKKEFTEYEYFSLKIGEETGTLHLVTQELGFFFTRKNEQRRTVINALTYPMIVLLTAGVVVIFMLRYVVPMFKDIFEQNRVQMPGITKTIISVSDSLKENSWAVLLGIGGLMFLRLVYRKKSWYKRYKDTFVSKLPFLGPFVNKVYLTQFTQAVALLTASKVPVLNSIQLVKKMVDYFPLQTALGMVENDILKGKSLSESLKGHSVFDKKMISLVRVAEETNQTEFIFQRLNQQYNTEVQQKSKTLSTVLEPIIILIVGILVGVILVAMYLPMFSLGTAIG